MYIHGIASSITVVGNTAPSLKCFTKNTSVAIIEDNDNPQLLLQRLFLHDSRFGIETMESQAMDIQSCKAIR
jgi:hypothetical protein